MKHKKSFSLPALPSLFSSSSQQPTSWSELGRARSGSGRNFVELLARSNFSFLMGASHPDELVLRAKQLGYRGLGLCDVNGLYGAVRGFQAAEKPSLFDASDLAANAEFENLGPDRKFRYHVGSELTPFDSSPVTLLPMSKEGYTRLSRLITRVKRPAAKGRSKLSLDDILSEAGHASGELLAVPLPPWNKRQLELMVEAFGDRLYLPVHKDSTWESLQLAREAIEFERTLGPSGLKLFATQRPLFHTPERKPLHDVLTCILHGTTLSQAKTKLTQNSERHLGSIDQLCLKFRDRPDLIDRTLEMSDRLQFSLSELKYKYPHESLPNGTTSAQYLRHLVEKGFQWRYPRSGTGMDAGTDIKSATEAHREKARRQVEHELQLIEQLEFEDYFLTLWDICQFARGKEILHQGRGSAANSIVCFTLGLTSIDPVKLGLLFERFLSLERAEPPDIDIDFEHERREEVIQYIYAKYGSEHAAMVCTTVCFRSRSAVREVAKVMGATLEQTDRLVKTMGREGLSHLLSQPIDSTKFGVTEEKFRMILKLAFEIKGFPRHMGIHSGGFVISHEPIVDIVPVESATMTDRYVIQWNKDDVAVLGLMKLDILSLGMLTAIKKSLALLKSKKNIEHTLVSIPHDDPLTYEMIQKAETIGVFQIESRAQMSLLPRLKPKEWYDLVVQVAIVRPGPIQGGLVHPYLKRRSGQEKITYAHPKLIPILAKTMGVPIFQEQVMRIVVAVAGFTPGEADELRRVVSSAWRKKAVMHGLRQRLINGMLANNVSVEYAEQIYKVIEGFSQYGFPESHAASFALLTYASCWLKRHHPDVFVVSLLNSQPMGFYPPRQLIADAERNGVVFHSLDIQKSDWDYTLTHAGHVRVGLRSVDGLREYDVQALIQAREKGGRFKDIEDFVRRTELSKKVLTRLATAGALFDIANDPRQALYTIQGIDFQQQSFFYGTEPVTTVASAVVNITDVSANDLSVDDGRMAIRPETNWESVRREYETKGFSLTHHPIQILRTAMTAPLRSQFSTAEGLKVIKNGAPVRLFGLRSLLQKPPTAKGVCFVSLEDETGIFNVILMPDVYERVRLILYTANILEIEGRLQNYHGVIHVQAKELRPFVERRTVDEAQITCRPL